MRFARVIVACTSFAVAAGGDVLFNELGQVAAPSSFGHVSFSLSREDLVSKYDKPARAIFEHFVEHVLEQNCSLESPNGDQRCQLAAVRDC